LKLVRCPLVVPSLVLPGMAHIPRTSTLLSLDFERDSAQHLVRNQGTATSATKGTLNLWWNRESATAATHTIIDADPAGGTNADTVYLQADHTLRFEIQGSAIFITSTTYADTSAWRNLHLACDASQTGTAKVRVSVNGTTPSFSTDNRGSFTAFSTWGQSGNNQIGARSFDDTLTWDGLLAAIRWYDDQFLADSDFAQDDGGTWKRKITPTSAAFGANGFYIDGSGAVGADASGNANNWTDVNGVVASSSVPPEI
jgi:hypothetical protein